MLLVVPEIAIAPLKLLLILTGRALTSSARSSYLLLGTSSRAVS